MAGFIDGDLVEKFIDLPRHQMDEIMRNMKVINYYYCRMWPTVLKWGPLFLKFKRCGETSEVEHFHLRSLTSLVGIRK